jgi:hypothetical protein
MSNETKADYENLSQHRQCPSKNSNQAPPKYKCRVLILDKAVWCDEAEINVKLACYASK